MKKSKQSILAYAAGMVDGEGCICIYKKKIRNKIVDLRKNFHLQVIVTQKDGRIIDWLIGNFGGSAYLHWKGSPTGYSHEWVLNHTNALKFLKQIEPFLIYKKNQAQIGIRFQERINTAGNRYKLTDHELEIRNSLYEEIKRLKIVKVYSKQPNIQNKVNNAALTTKCDNIRKDDAIV